MTDLDKFVELYKSVGIKVVVEHFSELATSDGTRYSITLSENDENEKLTGYSGFHSAISFDKEKRFIDQGFWE